MIVQIKLISSNLVLSLFCVIVSTPSYGCHAGRLTLVKIGLGIVRLFVLFVDDSILSSGGTGAQLGFVILCNLFVGLLGHPGTGALDRLRNIVCGVLLIITY